MKILYPSFHRDPQRHAQNGMEKLDMILQRRNHGKNIFLEIYQTSIWTTLQAFQFKLLHQILATKRRQFLWKIKDSDQCSFCKQESEIYIHLFTECPITVEFWNKVKDWYANMIGIRVDLNRLNIYLVIIYQNILL